MVFYVEQQHLRRERDAAGEREAALRLAYERMEQFLDVVSHELKTPLTSLQANIQLLARRLDALARSKGSLEDYTRAVVLLRTLVERCEHSLLRLRAADWRYAGHDPHSTWSAGVSHGTLRSGHARQRDSGRPGAAQPDAPDSVDGHGAHGPGDRRCRRIDQVVTNYLSNALKFSREDQAVEVRLETADGLARVSVHDQGIGVPLDEQAHLWERFYQAEATAWQSGSQIGLGIGLYISKTIVERHHGQVGIESSPGQGSTFWFTLPLRGDERS